MVHTIHLVLNLLEDDRSHRHLGLRHHTKFLAPKSQACIDDICKQDDHRKH